MKSRRRMGMDKITSIILLAYLMGAIQRVECSSVTSASSSSKYPFNAPIQYVKSAPPCVASKCKDGIVLIAIHIPDMTAMPQADNCGPLRIEQLDYATVLLTAGWRVDGSLLAERGREICTQNSAVYGCLGTATSRKIQEGGGGQRSMDYGTRLGWGLVNHLVQCHVKDSVRSLSTIGLLATTMSGPVDTPGELYMVDATGMYPCRALAIGSHSNQLNECLVQENFSDRNVDEVKDALLRIIRECSQGKRGNKKSGIFSRVMKKRKVSEEEDVDEIWRIPNESTVEIVVLKSDDTKPIRQKEQFMKSI